ncbi:MAG: GH36 C-terminal domain-containing protein, partial [Pseudomonadota bacterium]
ELKEVTAWYKANRGWMHAGDILGLDTADPSMIAEQQIAADGARFVVFSGKSENSAPSTQRALPLTALEPDSRYRTRLISRTPRPERPGMPAIARGPIEASGAWLMNHGIQLPTSWPGTMWVLEGERL